MKPKKGSQVWKLIVLVTGLVGLLIAFRYFHGEQKVLELQGWFKSLGPWGPVAFVLIYAVGVALAVPVTLFAFMAGILFGTFLGVVLSNIAVTIGACLAFLIARNMAREAVEQWVARSPQLKKLDQWVKEEGVWIVILNRLFPLLPFNLLNYAFGLTPIGFWDYAFWSWLCMIPAMVVYVAGADALHLYLVQGQVPWDLVALLAGIFCLLALLGFLFRKRIGRVHAKAKSR
jgi:uncharacterized membrane protein YdjX (TVP38/TMEM64 family)